MFFKNNLKTSFQKYNFNISINYFYNIILYNFRKVLKSLYINDTNEV